MKTGKSLQALAAEIERQMETKKDFIASTGKVELAPRERGMDVTIPGHGTFEVGDIAHGQISSVLKVPKQYYDRMRNEAPELLVNNIDTWFKKHPSPQMFRMLDGKNRAVLSDKFACLDNYDFAEVTLPVLQERNLDIVSCDITEQSLYIKAVDKQLFRDVPVGYKMGDGSHKIFRTCAPVVILRNSEVGLRSLGIETGVYDSACTNLCWFASGGFRKTHVGARNVLAEGIDAAELEKIMSTATRNQTVKAMWMQVRDVIKSAFSEDVIRRRAEQIEEAAKRTITKAVEDVLEVVATDKRFGLNQGEKSGVLKHLIEGGSLTQWGLHAAVTRAAQDADNYDRATEMEYLGGKIIELNRNEWASLAEAA